MFNFLNNYKAKQRFKKSESLCSAATIILLNLDKGIQLLGDTYPEIMNNIINKNTDEKDLPKSFSSHIFSNIRSLFTGRTISIEKGWKQSQETYVALQVYKEAALICPENLDPLWRIIEILHHEGQNDEAFAQYSSMPNHKLNEYDMVHTIPAIIGMLVSVGQKKEAIDIVDSVLNKFSAKQNHNSREVFLSLLLFEVLFFKIDRINDYINLIKNINPSLTNDLAKNIALRAHLSINNDNLKDALAWIDISLDIDSNNQEFLNIKKEIEQDLKKGKTWSTIKTKNEFFKYLFRRLAHLFHPDFATDDNQRLKNTKIMSKINKAYGDNNLQELKNITKEYKPSWVKYFKF